MTTLNRQVGLLGEYSDDAHNDGGQGTVPGRTVTGASPASIVANTSTTVSVNGTGFAGDSDIFVDGVEKTTTFVTPSQLRASVTPAGAGQLVLTVGGATGSATVTVTAAAGE
jgi:IPT/TIG domain